MGALSSLITLITQTINSKQIFLVLARSLNGLVPYFGIRFHLHCRWFLLAYLAKELFPVISTLRRFVYVWFFISFLYGLNGISLIFFCTLKFFTTFQLLIFTYIIRYQLWSSWMVFFKDPIYYFWRLYYFLSLSTFSTWSFNLSRSCASVFIKS